LAQREIHELAHFAAAFADQSDHDHVGHGLARDQAEQHTLAHAAARHEPDTLALAEREHAIDGAYAHVERLVDRALLERIDARGLRLEQVLATERTAPVDGLAQAVDA